jgi:hypothetical protein
MLASTVLSRIDTLKQQSKTPVVVFDLDGTLFDNGPRTWHIVAEFCEAEALWPVRKKLDASPRTRLPYVLSDWLTQLGVTDAATIDSARTFWSARFFDDAHQRYDEPLAGATHFARACWNAGATLVYLSGRDAPNMLVGVCDSLRQHRFPVGVAQTVVVLKPSFHDDDLAFKRNALSFVDTLGTVVATFDNEPANCNLFASRFPTAMNFFVDTTHAPNPPPLTDVVLTVADFT